MDGWDVAEQKLMKNWFASKEVDPKKLFYISYGPMGSGKRTIPRKAMAMEKHPVKEPVEVLVDELIAAVPGYKDEMSKCSNKCFAQNFYWRARLQIDDLSDAIMEEALRKGYNVLMEMTGRRLDHKWFREFVNQVRQHHYRVVVAYPVVAIHKLVDRVQARQKKMGQEAAPDEKVREAAVMAADNLPKLQQFVSDASILLYDNNGAKGEEKLIVAYNFHQQNLADCSFLKTWLAEESPRGSSDMEKSQAQVMDSLKQWVKGLLVNGIYDVKTGAPCFDWDESARLSKPDER